MTGAITNNKPTTHFETKRVLITPKLAQETLEFNTKNRRLNPSRVEEYAKIMKEGLFQCTHQGIALDIDGNVVDGQHRLAAIVKSGCSCYMLVSKGVPDTSRLVVDTHQRRNTLAIAMINGRVGDTTAHYAIARILKYGPIKATQMHLQPQEIFRMVDTFQECINFVYRHGRGINSTTLAVVARAYFTKDRTRLIEFMDVMRTQMVKNEGDTAAIKLKVFLTERDSTQGRSGNRWGNIKQYTYQLTESALMDFLNRYPTKQLTPTKIEKFPLPVELDGWNPE